MKTWIILVLNIVIVFILYRVHYHLNNRIEGLHIRLEEMKTVSSDENYRTPSSLHPISPEKASGSPSYALKTHASAIEKDLRKGLDRCERNLDNRPMRTDLKGTEATMAFQRNSIEKLLCKLEIYNAGIKQLLKYAAQNGSTNEPPKETPEKGADLNLKKSPVKSSEDDETHRLAKTH